MFKLEAGCASSVKNAYFLSVDRYLADFGKIEKRCSPSTAGLQLMVFCSKRNFRNGMRSKPRPPRCVPHAHYELDQLWKLHRNGSMTFFQCRKALRWRKGE